MSRFLTFAVAAVLAVSMNSSLWSQAGGGGGASGGGGSASGGASSSATSTSGSAAGTGTAGSSANTGTVGSNSATGTVGTGVGTGQNPTTSPGAGANFRFGGPSATPFFSDPGVRQQLNLNDNQFNTLHRAYQNAYNRYNQSVTGLGPNNANNNTRIPTSQREQNQDFRSRINNNTNVGDGTNTAAEQRARQLQEFESRFNSDFRTSVDQNITDPRLRRRFDQLNRQFMGFNNFNDPAIQRQLNLTTDQQRQLRQLTSDWRRQMMDWRRGLRVDDPAAQQQWGVFRNQYNDQLNAILTPQQQQAWLGMMGQPYEFPYTLYFPQNQVAPAADASAPTNQTQLPTGTTRAPTGGTTVR
jgi:hypothetical protein